MRNVEISRSDGDGGNFPVAQFLSNASNLILRSALRTYPALTGLKVVEARTLHKTDRAKNEKPFTIGARSFGEMRGNIQIEIFLSRKGYRQITYIFW